MTESLYTGVVLVVIIAIEELPHKLGTEPIPLSLTILIINF